MQPFRYLIVVGSAALLSCVDTGTDPVAERSAEPPVGPLATTSDNRIAFASSRGGAWPHIYVANSNGTFVTRVALGSAPAWSRDGTKIAFFRDENPYDKEGVYVMNADGSDQRFLAAGRNPAWSADGRIVVSLTGLFVIEGTGLRRLLGADWVRTTAGEPCGEDGWSRASADYPAWSPDGQRIAFLLTCSSEWSRLFVMNADGTEPRELIESGGPPAWSPDGSRIAVAAGSINIIHVSSGLRDVFPIAAFEGKLDWSPDGRHIAFEGGDWDRKRIFVLALETGEVRQLIPATIPDYYKDFDVAWSRVK